MTFVLFYLTYIDRHLCLVPCARSRILSLIWRILKKYDFNTLVRNMKKQREEFKIWTSRTSQSSKYLQHGKVILESWLQLDLYFFAVIGGPHSTPRCKTVKKPNYWEWTVIRNCTFGKPILPSILSKNFTSVPSTFRSQDRLLFSAYSLIRRHFWIPQDRPYWGPEVFVKSWPSTFDLFKFENKHVI